MPKCIVLTLSGSITCGEGDSLLCSVRKLGKSLGMCQIERPGEFREDLVDLPLETEVAGLYGVTLASDGVGIIRVGRLAIIATGDDGNVYASDVQETSPIAILNFNGVGKKSFEVEIAVSNGPVL